LRDRRAPCGEEPADSDADGIAAIVHAALHGPAEVSAGATLMIRADIDVEDAVEELVVRVREVAGARYVPGSTSLDARALLDRAGMSPLAGGGLLLRSIPAGMRVTAAWTLLADPAVCDEALIVEATLAVDGREQSCEPIAVHVRGRDAFAAQPGGLPYHVDACVITAELPGAPPDATLVMESFEPPEADTLLDEPRRMIDSLSPSQTSLPCDEAFTFSSRLEADRLGEVARLLDADGGGLVPHVLALRSLLPDRETSDDPRIAAALDGMRHALRDVFDRLFVKLRIPGFDVVSDDVDDIVLRSALIGLFERLLDASPGSDRCDGAAVRITRERVRELLAAFADAPYGSPAMLRALVALMPTRCEFDPVLSAALARYACALDDVLARYEGVPLELFDDALARASDRALDDARTGLVVALRGRAAFAEVAC
jgi:hypothetical protein